MEAISCRNISIRRSDLCCISTLSLVRDWMCSIGMRKRSPMLTTMEMTIKATSVSMSRKPRLSKQRGDIAC